MLERQAIRIKHRFSLASAVSAVADEGERTRGELRSYLVRSARIELDLNEGLSLLRLYCLIRELRFLDACALALYDVGLVFSSVVIQ